MLNTIASGLSAYLLFHFFQQKTTTGNLTTQTPFLPHSAWFFKLASGIPENLSGFVVVAILCFVAAAGALVVARATHRLPGQTSSGSVTLTDDQRLAQQLTQARVLAGQGRDLDAIKLYDKVLAVAPRQPEALAYRGWLLRLAGAAGHDQALLAQGRASVGAAVAQDPGYPDARAFLGYILIQDAHDPVGASEQFRAFLADHPQAQMVALTRDVVAQAFAAVGQPVPPASSPTGS